MVRFEEYKTWTALMPRKTFYKLFFHAFDVNYHQVNAVVDRLYELANSDRLNSQLFDAVFGYINICTIKLMRGI